MTEILLATIRLAMLLMLISVTLAIIITVTRYYIGMFTALPYLMIPFLFVIILGILFFVGDLIK